MDLSRPLPSRVLPLALSRSLSLSLALLGKEMIEEPSFLLTFLSLSLSLSLSLCLALSLLKEG